MGTEEVRKAFEELQGKERERLLKEYGAELQILTSYAVPKDHLLFVQTPPTMTMAQAERFGNCIKTNMPDLKFVLYNGDVKLKVVGVDDE